MSQQRKWIQHPSALEKVVLKEMMEVSAKCARRGWTEGTAGNFSIRLRTPVAWVSRSGVDKSSLSLESFLPLNIESLELMGYSPAEASAEAPLHAAIYRTFPACRAIVHIHPCRVVQASLRQIPFVFQNHEMIKVFGAESHEVSLTIPTIDNTQDMIALGSTHKFDLNTTGLVLRGHGVYMWGSSPAHALALAEAFDFMCQTQIPAI